MEKLYYTIGEAAEMLGENVSLVRYWSDNFSRFLKPHRNAKGNRMYTADDLEVLKQISGKSERHDIGRSQEEIDRGQEKCGEPCESRGLPEVDTSATCRNQKIIVTIWLSRI